MIFKTRVFVTNSVNFLPQTDEIIILVSGAIAGKGKYDDLLNRNSSFTNFLKKYLNLLTILSSKLLIKILNSYSSEFLVLKIN